MTAPIRRVETSGVTQAVSEGFTFGFQAHLTVPTPKEDPDLNIQNGG